MTENALRIIGKAMSALGLDYGFVTYRKKPVRYPYFVGEYNEVESMNEDGLQEISFMLTGFARGEGAWQALESAKRSIQNYFTRGGRAFRFADGSVAVVMYANAFPVPKEDAELKSIQINLSIKEWSVNEYVH